MSEISGQKIVFGDVRAELALRSHETSDNHRRLIVSLHCKTDIEDAVTVRADKKPSGYIAVLSKHVVKPVFVPTLRTILELVFHLNRFDFIIHFLFLKSRGYS